VRWLLVLFIVVPFVELYLLLVIGRYVGFWPTVGMIIVPGVLGATLAKAEGLRVWRSYKSALAEGKLPDEGILGGLLVLIGGVLLITPGVLTDLTGILLLLPFTRRFVAGVIRKRIEERIGQGLFKVVSVGGPFGGGVDVRDDDNEVEVIDPGYESPFAQGRHGRWQGADVVDTEGVEVQSTNLLPPPKSQGSGGGSGDDE